MHLRNRHIALALTVAVALLSSCGGAKTSSAKIDGTYTAKSSLEAAVKDMLTAQEAGDFKASFAILDPGARSQYKDVADWTARQHELPLVTGFKLTTSKDATQTVAVDHKPGLDPFIGLSPAHETQVWTGHHYGQGWLLDPDPASTPVLPSDEKATAAVKAWAQAVQACDQDKAMQLQAIPQLIASSAPVLCKVPGDIVVSGAQTIDTSLDTQALVAQYSTDALSWGRSVTILAPVSVHVIVAPIGDDWKVLALA